MTFDVLEESSYSGTPVTLYRFGRGDRFADQVWRYTNAESDVTITEYIGNNSLGKSSTYAAYPISDAGITLSGEPSQDQLVITMPWDSPIVALFSSTPPSVPVNISVSHMHYGDPSGFRAAAGLDASVRLMWIGSISQVRRTNPGTAEVTCNTMVQSFERNGLRLAWTRTCPYILYDPKTCKVDRTLHKVVGSVVSFDGASLQVAALAGSPDGTFTSGYVEWVTAMTEANFGHASVPVFERRAIANHVGSIIRLLGSTDGVSVGLSVTVYRGCNRLITTCNDVFANIDNCGASPFMPGVSPFDGNPVF